MITVAVVPHYSCWSLTVTPADYDFACEVLYCRLLLLCDNGPWVDLLGKVHTRSAKAIKIMLIITLHQCFMAELSSYDIIRFYIGDGESRTCVSHP